LIGPDLSKLFFSFLDKNGMSVFDRFGYENTKDPEKSRHLSLDLE
jgi:hypothetical protein